VVEGTRRGILYPRVPGDEVGGSIDKVAQEYVAHMVAAIHKVYAGKKHIPPEVALTEHLTMKRCRNKIIAATLNPPENTVKGHLKSILSKLGANDRTHAVMITLHRGLLHV
jgi:hypothetical protein